MFTACGYSPCFARGGFIHLFPATKPCRKRFDGRPSQEAVSESVLATDAFRVLNRERLDYTQQRLLSLMGWSVTRGSCRRLGDFRSARASLEHPSRFLQPNLFSKS